MVARVLLVVVVFICGAEAVPFANGADLEAAVVNCLAYDITGVACCGSAHDPGCGEPSTARCFVAGCDEMPLWNTSSVTNMDSMFQDTSAFNADISGWDTSSLTWDYNGKGDMFLGATAWLASYARLDIAGSSTDGPPSAWYLVPFANHEDLKDAVDACLDYDPTGIACCSKTHDASCDSSNVAERRCGVAGCHEMPLWNTSSVWIMRSMFEGAVAFNADISGWVTSSVTNMHRMFWGATSFNTDISAWDTSSVQTMGQMFYGAISFNADISGWDTADEDYDNVAWSSVFEGATAWLASCSRSGESTDGPPSAWNCTWSPPPSPPPPSPPPPASNSTNVLSISVDGAIIALGHSHSCALLADGKVNCWGENHKGQLGDGTTDDSTHPVEVSSITTATSVALGFRHSCALLTDGKVVCWGDNEDATGDGFGQLGDGTTTSSSTTPVEVSNITTATSIALGDFHSCAVLTDGNIKCWGYNNYGMLGDGTTTDSTTPVEVLGITTALSVALGGMGHSCAVLTDGKVKCWGQNDSGQLGDGTTTHSSTPVEVSGITMATSIALGDAHSCAVLTDGTVKCWGRNSNGQLGDGTSTSRYTPVEVSGITSAANIDLGSYHSCAVLTDGKVKCWGQNDSGQLGDGTTTDRTTPVEVSGITTSTSISLGTFHSCAVLTDGKVMCWGNNAQGEVGDGTWNQRLSPVEVVGLLLSPSPPPPSSNATAVPPPASNTNNVTSPPPVSSNATAVPPPPRSPSPPPPLKSFVFLADYESSAGRASILTALVVVSILSAL